MAISTFNSLYLYWAKHEFLFFLVFFNVYLFLKQRETEHERGRGRERGRHRTRSRLQALSCQPRAWHGARTHGPWDRDLSWSQMLNRLSHPGALSSHILKSKRRCARWLSRASIGWGSDSWFRLKSWSQGRGNEPCGRLCAECGACLWLSLTVSLPLLCSSLCTRSLSLSQNKKNK